MNTAPKFKLSKWYMDCVTESGEVFIGYCAQVQWRALVIHYSSALTRQRDSGTRNRTSTRRCPAPALAGSILRWSSPRLSVEGTWEAIDPPCRRTLLATEAGSVEWRCEMPRARAEISLEHGRQVRGLGYGEFLEMTIAPWELPIDELRWGRFVSDTDAMTWIDWSGAHPLTVVVCNGNVSSSAAVSDRLITVDNKRAILRIEEPRVLREGPLARTVLAKIPGVRKLLPERILKTHECKWRSRGTLEEDGRIRSTGWVIHEVVRWS